MDPRTAIRQRLQEVWKRCPDWIGSASVQSVREYKKTHAAMMKLIDKSSATLSQLQAADNQTRTIYK